MRHWAKATRRPHTGERATRTFYARRVCTRFVTGTSARATCTQLARSEALSGKTRAANRSGPAGEFALTDAALGRTFLWSNVSRNRLDVSLRRENSFPRDGESRNRFRINKTVCIKCFETIYSYLARVIFHWEELSAKRNLCLLQKSNILY